MYQYFGYDMIDDIWNENYRYTQYVSKLIFLAIKSPHKSHKILFSYIFANLLPILALIDATNNIMVHIVSRFNVSMIQ